LLLVHEVVRYVITFLREMGAFIDLFLYPLRIKWKFKFNI
jgi:hypothetical protein